jgi:tRNA (cytidine/uridine-2'-O-)-methyltransferase
MMFHIILYQPEIPPNTGNIIRLCANTGTSLQLIQPLGFKLDEKSLRRAGLDYGDMAGIGVFDSLDECLEACSPGTVYAMTTRGRRCYADVRFEPDDALLFGPETRGLPDDLLGSLPDKHLLRIPMLGGNRSLNLSNCAAIVIYEAWRQHGFPSSLWF